MRLPSVVLDPGIEGVRKKWRILSRADRLMGRLQLCLAGRCLGRARIAIRARYSVASEAPREVEVGLCRVHAEELMHGQMMLKHGWTSLGERFLTSDEILPGPIHDLEGG